MPRRNVDSSNNARFIRETSKTVRNSGGKLLPRGYAWVSKADGLYIQNLKTGAEEKFGAI